MPVSNRVGFNSCNCYIALQCCCHKQTCIHSQQSNNSRGHIGLFS